MDDLNRQLVLHECVGGLEYAAESEEPQQTLPGSDWQHCVVGCVLQERPINFNTFKTIMANIWRPRKSVNVKELGKMYSYFSFFMIKMCIMFLRMAHGIINNILYYFGS